MTREEAIKTLQGKTKTKIASMLELREWLKFRKALDMAIKALEQEPVLDKIRAEIIERDRNVKAIRSDGRCFFTAEEVLKVIDKYRG